MKPGGSRKCLISYQAPTDLRKMGKAIAMASMITIARIPIFVSRSIKIFLSVIGQSADGILLQGSRMWAAGPDTGFTGRIPMHSFIETVVAVAIRRKEGL